MFRRRVATAFGVRPLGYAGLSKPVSVKRIKMRPNNLASGAVGNLLFLALALIASSLAHAEGRPDAPKLVLQITVDQLRGDLPYRYYD
jgi:hypothetical protein